MAPIRSDADDAFNEALANRLRADFNNAHERNWDASRYGPEPKNVEALDRTLEECYRIIPDFDRIGYLYNRLRDDVSKSILVGLFAYRMLGYRKVMLPRNTDFYWDSLSAAQALQRAGADLKIRFAGLSDFSLPLLDLHAIGYNLKLFIPPNGVNLTFLQKQYELHRGELDCKAKAGDVVIDAGGCWGDTALYFAHEVGPKGRVVSFEFIPSNIDVMKKNLELNANLRGHVTLVPHPLWSTPGNELHYVDRGPASSVSNEKISFEGALEGMCTTTTVDKTIDDLGLNKCDFIKMDIEGAELEALKGAEKTIRMFRPKMAICLYHSVDDFRSIPRYIESLDLGYEFYINHATIHLEETVLFCVPSPAFRGENDIRHSKTSRFLEFIKKWSFSRPASPPR